MQRFAVADRGGWLPPPDALQAATAAGSEQAGALQVGHCRSPHTLSKPLQNFSQKNGQPTTAGLLVNLILKKPDLCQIVTSMKQQEVVSTIIVRCTERTRGRPSPKDALLQQLSQQCITEIQSVFFHRESSKSLLSDLNFAVALSANSDTIS